jgi:hypothetical protein
MTRSTSFKGIISPQQHNDRPALQRGQDHSFDDWKLNGTCQTDPNLSVDDFYDLQSKTLVHIQMLRDTCAACPVLEQCHELGRKEPWGFLAGKTEEQRNRAKQNEKRARYVEKNKEAIVQRKKDKRDRKKEEALRAEKRRVAREETEGEQVA